jgi:hypothetical protein
MKLLNLKKKFSKLRELNKSLKKYSMLIMSGLFLFMKKEKMSKILPYLIISLIGFLFMNNEKKNMKMQDKNEFTNSQDSNENKNDDYLEDFYENKINNDETDNEDDESEENNNENEENNNDENKENKKINKIINKNLKENNYPTNLNKLTKDYSKKNTLFKLKINENNKNMPLFNLRTSDKIDFYWNFHLHNSDTKKINNLILCRDINQWMNNSSISDDDLENQCYPFYIIIRDRKSNDEIMIFEVYKIFVYCDENSNKQAFIIKGDNYKTAEEILTILFELNYVKDLLNGKEYENYNLSVHDSVTLFLNNLLSHFLPYDAQDDESINIDLKQLNENKNTFEYFYHTNTLDNDMFNTNI